MKTTFGIVAAIAVVVIFFVGRWSVGGQKDKASGEASTSAAAESKEASLWTCPMHPQIQLPDPGKCPICSMILVPMVKDDLGPRQFAMSEAARKLASIQTTLVERRFVTRHVRLVGKVDYDETVVKTIAARVPGRLDRLYVDYTGVSVSKGDHLVWLYSPELLTAQEELLESRKRIKATAGEPSTWLAKSNLKAYASAQEKLLLWGLTEVQIRQILDRGEADDHMMITSPVSGVVIHKALNEGDYVREGTRIYAIADLKQLWIRLDAYEQDLPWIRYGQIVTIQTESHPGEDFEGWISFVDPVLDEKTRTIKVRVNVKNPEGKLKPGMFVRAVVNARLAGHGELIDGHVAGKWICPMHPEIVKETAGDCPICGMALQSAEKLGYVASASTEKPLVIPVSSVLVTGTRAVVYVKVPGTKRPTYEGREVVLGPRAGDFYILKEGLQENERVVTHGAYRIDSALQILAKPSMMSLRGERGDTKSLESRRFRASLASLFTAYMTAQEALAKDEPAAVKKALTDLSTSLSLAESAILSRSAKIRWNEEMVSLARSSKKVIEGTDLAKMRLSFSDISKSMMTVEELFGHPGSERYYSAFCPMAFNRKGAFWIQRGKVVHNPYFGQAMLSCGEIRDDYPGSEPEEEGQKEEEEEAGQETPHKAVPKPDSRKSGSEKEPGKQVKASPGPLDGVYPSYLALQKALAGDDLKGATAALASMKTVVGGIQGAELNADAQADWKGYAEALASAEKAKDLEGLRTSFAGLSKHLISLTLLLGYGGTSTYFQINCSMAFDGKGADWIQDHKVTKNPFYGLGMLGCGEVVRELPARGGR